MADRRKDRRLGLQKMFDDYVERLQDDFTRGAEQSAQGVGDIVERGNVLTGIPRLALGGLGWMGSPVSAAVSPVLGPLLAPVAEATDTYVGQPVERMTGYPADLTNEIFLSTAIPVAGSKIGRMASPYLSRLADAAETGANRAGYTFRPPEGTFFSGAGPVKLADDGGGLLSQSVDVSSDIGLRPNAGEAIDATNSVFRAHPADSQSVGNMRLSPKLSSVDNLKEMLDDLGFKVEAHERSTSNTETFGPSASQYLTVVAPNGQRIKVRLSDHNYLAPDGGADLRYGSPSAIAQEQLLRAAGMEIPDNVQQSAAAARSADAAAGKAAAAAKEAAENQKKLPRIAKALERAESNIGKGELDRLLTLARSSNPGAGAARKQLQQFGLFQSEFSLIDMLPPNQAAQGTFFSGAGPVKLADDVADVGQGASVDGMDTKLKPWRTPTMRDGIPSNLQKAYEAGIAVQRAADAEGSDVLSFLTDHSYNPRPGIPSIEDLAQINENPTMNAFYQAGNKGYAMPRLVTGQRYGDAPLAGVSYNYREQTPELGVSMAKVDAQEFSDYQWADFFNKNRPIKSFEGWLLPKPMTGSDDEPLMVGLRKIANKNKGGGT